MPAVEIAPGGLIDAFAADVRRGLTSTPKSLDPRYFYDPLGSALFAAICELPEYYVTRTEKEILDEHAGDIVTAFQPPVARLVELGSGNAQKTSRLIEALLSKQRTLLYQPIDVDAAVLETSRRDLMARFRGLDVRPIDGDFAAAGNIGPNDGRSIVLFLGSSIGNLDHRSAAALLRATSRIVRSGDGLFIGFDLKKPPALLHAAYNDSLGVTASFNRNLLARINRELGANFRLDRFAHRAFWNEAESRIEMHLESEEKQTVRIAALGIDIEFAPGETIHTENSYKYDSASIEALTAEAGLEIERRWSDRKGWFTDVLLRPKGN